MTRLRLFLSSLQKAFATESSALHDDLQSDPLQWRFFSPFLLEDLLHEASTSVGCIFTKAKDPQLEALNAWMAEQLLPPGTLAYDFADPDSGDQRAMFYLAWPSGIQAELSQPVAVLLNEGQETLAVASGAGFPCFTSPEAFLAYVLREIISEPQAP